MQILLFDIFLIFLQINCESKVYISNKMEVAQLRLKTQSSAIEDPRKQFIRSLKLELRDDIFSKRPHQSKPQSNQKITSKQRTRKRTIKEENLRLISKIIQIRTRKSPYKESKQKVILKKKDNPQKQRSIILQNQRLGKSLLMIKTGKTVEKVINQFNRIKNKNSFRVKTMTDSTSSRMINLFSQSSIKKGQSFTQNNFLPPNFKTQNSVIDIDEILQQKRRIK